MLSRVAGHVQEIGARPVKHPISASVRNELQILTSVFYVPVSLNKCKTHAGNQAGRQAGRQARRWAAGARKQAGKQACIRVHMLGLDRTSPIPV